MDDDDLKKRRDSYARHHIAIHAEHVREAVEGLASASTDLIPRDPRFETVAAQEWEFIAGFGIVRLAAAAGVSSLEAIERIRRQLEIVDGLKKG